MKDLFESVLSLRFAPRIASRLLMETRIAPTTNAFARRRKTTFRSAAVRSHAWVRPVVACPVGDPDLELEEDVVGMAMRILAQDGPASAATERRAGMTGSGTDPFC